LWRAADLGLAQNLWELLELCDSRESVVQSQLLLSDTPLRPNRGPYRRGLRRLPRGLRRAADLGLAQNLWELLELCDSRDGGGSVAAVVV
jgi:hypothetical protein